MSIYVIGANSGFGKYLSENMNLISITRENFSNDYKPNKKSIIFCCANNKNKFPNTENLYDFYRDNIDLIRKISLLPHAKIFFFSSIEVYSISSLNMDENEVIDINGQNPYAFSKLISEQILINNSNNFVILRLSALLGSHSNSLINRLMNHSDVKTNLSASSSFNYILYSDLLKLLLFLINNQFAGILNVASNSNISLNDSCNFIDKTIKFGKYKYVTPAISNKKLLKIAPFFDKSSLDVLKEFII